MRKTVTISKRYPPEVRDKAMRLAPDHLDEYPSAYTSAHAIGPMVDVHPETLRVWILKAKASGAGDRGGRGAQAVDQRVPHIFVVQRLTQLFRPGEQQVELLPGAQVRDIEARQHTRPVPGTRDDGPLVIRLVGDRQDLPQPDDLVGKLSGPIRFIHTRPVFISEELPCARWIVLAVTTPLPTSHPAEPELDRHS